MESERESVRFLEDGEIKEGICQKVAEALMAELNKTCNLHGRSYAKFRGRVKVELELDDLQTVTVERRTVEINPGEAFDGQPVAVAAEVVIEEMPPNQFRMETDQPILMKTVEDGRTVEKKVKYKAAKR
ncbi:MAG TPA: hypothetical protein VGG62_16235 [Terracidiphilus sp.]|jgi:hypothetical protein